MAGSWIETARPRTWLGLGRAAPAGGDAQDAEDLGPAPRALLTAPLGEGNPQWPRKPRRRPWREGSSAHVSRRSSAGRIGRFLLACLLACLLGSVTRQRPLASKEGRNGFTLENYTMNLVLRLTFTFVALSLACVMGAGAADTGDTCKGSLHMQGTPPNHSATLNCRNPCQQHCMSWLIATRWGEGAICGCSTGPDDCCTVVLVDPSGLKQVAALGECGIPGCPPAGTCTLKYLIFSVDPPDLVVSGICLPPVD